MNEIQQEWYKELVEECKAIITEAIFTSRWALVEGYWKLGERIRTDDNVKKIGGKGYSKELTSLLQGLAVNIGISERTLWYALQAYDKYPALDKIPDGKNITWNKLITQYLPQPKENKIEIPLPKGKYELIVIDPPWNYGTEYNSETRRVASPYKELIQDELKKIEIPSADNSVLWIWTTHKFIWDAKELLEHWGFDYKAILVWDKQKLGMGEWLRMQAEFSLLGIKGKPKWNLTNERDILSSARREHSRKPDAFYSLVENLTSTEHKIDMFGREKRDGWVLWGNENKF